MSEALLCRMALSRIGAVASINTLDTNVDTSVECAACNLWYPQERDATLTDWPWPWAQGSSVLAQINTLYPATPEYQYSYRYPTDCLVATRVVETVTPQAATSPPQTTGIGAAIQSGDNQWWLRPEGDPNPWSFRIGSDASGRLVLTDLANASLIYTRSLTDPTLFAADFVSLLAWRLAIPLALELAVSEARATRAEKGYKAELMKTRARFANEGQTDIASRYPNSEFVRRRYS